MEEGAERLEKSVIVDNFMKAAFYRHNVVDAHMSSQRQHEVSPKFNTPHPRPGSYSQMVAAERGTINSFQWNDTLGILVILQGRPHVQE